VYEPPQGEVETTVAAIWSELLGVAQVGRRHNFFELGGHSLLIAKMVQRLSLAGLRMELSSIFEAPTLAALCDLVDQSPVIPSGGHAVPIRTGGTQRPLFFVHEPSGEVLPYVPLADHLDPDIPVYGLQASELHEPAPKYLSVQDMAIRHSRVIRQVKPTGPYRLAGWSTGGTLAYELARLLLAEGEEVEFLGLIDTSRNMEISIAHKVKALDEVAFLLTYLEDLNPSLDEETRRVLNDAKDLPTLVALSQKASLISPEFSAAEILRRTALYQHLCDANDAYFHPALPITVHLFAATASDADEKNRQAWAQLQESRLVVTPLEGTHTSVMQDPHLMRVLAYAMSRAVGGDRPFHAD